MQIPPFERAFSWLRSVVHENAIISLATCALIPIRTLHAMTEDEALRHLRNVLAERNPDLNRLGRDTAQRYLGEAAARGRVYDGSIAGGLARTFVSLIRDRMKNALEETKRIFSMPDMPVDDSTKAGVKTILSDLQNQLVGLAQRSLDGLAELHRMRKPNSLASEIEIESLATAWPSEIDLLFHAASASQERQVILRAGETLKANLVLRQIFQSAQSSIDVYDPYIGVRFFALLSDKRPQVSVRILSADVKPADRQTAMDFKKDYGGLELREQKSGMHDRFIIIDRTTAYMVGHSMKDLGSRDTAVTEAPDPKSVIDLFEDRWNAAQALV
jgi:hypothetical protein